MSVRVMASVWKWSRAKGSALLLLLAIADNAHDDGGGAWPSQATLAAKTRLSVRQVRRLIGALVHLGELGVEKRVGTSDLYTVTVGPDKMSAPAPSDAATDVLPGRTLVTGTGDILVMPADIAVSAEPSEPSPKQQGSHQRATARPDGETGSGAYLLLNTGVLADPLWLSMPLDERGIWFEIEARAAERGGLIDDDALGTAFMLSRDVASVQRALERFAGNGWLVPEANGYRIVDFHSMTDDEIEQAWAVAQPSAGLR